MGKDIAVSITLSAIDTTTPLSIGYVLSRRRNRAGQHVDTHCHLIGRSFCRTRTGFGQSWMT